MTFFHYPLPSNHSDPNAMDMDTITLSKLTPAEWAYVLKKDSASIAGRRVIVSTNALTLEMPNPGTNSHPQTICSTKINSSTTPSPAGSPFAIGVCVGSLKTQEKNEVEILQVLQIYYEESKEEISVISTSDQDF